MDDDCFHPALLDFWLTVYAHFSKQIEKTVQYNEKNNGIAHFDLKKMLIMFFSNSAFYSCFQVANEIILTMPLVMRRIFILKVNIYSYYQSRHFYCELVYTTKYKYHLRKQIIYVVFNEITYLAFNPRGFY